MHYTKLVPNACCYTHRLSQSWRRPSTQQRAAEGPRAWYNCGLVSAMANRPDPCPQGITLYGGWCREISKSIHITPGSRKFQKN